MHRHFEDEQHELQQQLLHLGGLAESMLRNSVESVLQRDEVMAREVIARDDEADAMENQIEEFCIELIARNRPAASDLRFMTMAMKINRDLERMADEAVNIAERSLELLQHPPVKPFIDLPRVAELVQRMVKDALDAFVRRDAALAEEVRERDDEVDEIYDQVVRELLTYLIDQPRLVRPGISVLLLFRHLERIADLAANIVEEVYYVIEGSMIRHSGISKHGGG